MRARACLAVCGSARCWACLGVVVVRVGVRACVGVVGAGVGVRGLCKDVWARLVLGARLAVRESARA